MTLKKFKVCFILIALANSYPLTAQAYLPYNLEIGIHKNIFLHKINFPNEYNGFPLGLSIVYWRDLGTQQVKNDVEIIRLNKYKSLFNKMYNYPQVGLYFSYLTQMHEDLGSGYTLGATTDIGVWQKKSNYISIRPKIGLSFITKRYDKTNNTNNTYIGSFINLNIGFGVFYTIQAPIHTLKLGVELNHFSNGAIKFPNNGLNLASLGISYQFGSVLYPWVKSERMKLQEVYRSCIVADTNHLKLQFSGFTKQYRANSARYFGVNFAAIYTRPLNLWVDAEAKLNLSIDPSRGAELTHLRKKASNNLRSGISFGFTNHIHRLDLYANAGVYIYKLDIDLDQFWFQNYQLDYKISKKMYTFVGITAHGKEVDFLEIGLGCRL